MTDRFDERTALLVVDVQNDFADPDGGLSVAGGEAIIPAINGAVRLAVAAGATVVYSQDWHPAVTPHFAKDGGVWPEHCVAGTWGAEFHPALDVAPQHVLVRKGVDGEDGYSAFTVRDPRTGEASPTDLRAALEQRGIERVVVCGIAQDVCVLETVLDARDAGYATTVLADAMAPVNLQFGDGARAVVRMVDAGAEVV